MTQSQKNCPICCSCYAANDSMKQRGRTALMPFAVLAAKGFLICLWMRALWFNWGGHKQNIKTGVTVMERKYRYALLTAALLTSNAVWGGYSGIC